jgi:signal transduction histidine kinase
LVVASHWELHRDEQGNSAAILEVSSDATELHNAREALLESDRRKDKFLAMLAHELRNPMVAIRNAVELLRRVSLPEAGQSRARDIIDRQSEHLARLVDDLLDVSRITQDKIILREEKIELRSVIGHAAETVRPLIDAREQLSVSLPEPASRGKNNSDRSDWIRQRGGPRTVKRVWISSSPSQAH